MEAIDQPREMLEIIECGRVRLEKVNISHRDDLYNLIADSLKDRERLKYLEYDGEEIDKEKPEDWIEGLIEDYEGKDKFAFAIYDRDSKEFVGFTNIYRACCPYKKDKEKAAKWEQENKNSWESVRVMQKEADSYGTDAKKAVLTFVFRCLEADKFITACALEQQKVINSSLKAGLKPDPEFRGQDLDNLVKDGVNEEGYESTHHEHLTEFRLIITRSEFEKKAEEGFYD